MKKLRLMLLLSVAGVMGWRACRSDAPDSKLIFDRFWVDHEARSKHEKFLAMWVMSDRPIGRFVTRTRWTGQWEEFHYHVLPREERTMELLFGNNDERQRMRWLARPCHDNGFDYCLEITGTSRGTRRYYSKKEWNGKQVSFEAIADSLTAE